MQFANTRRTTGKLLTYSLLACFCVEPHAQPVPPQCRPLAKEVASLASEIRDLQGELSTAAPGAKPRLTSDIRRLGAQLSEKRRALQACNPRPPTCTPETVCTRDSATSNPNCKICRRDNCDGTASVYHTC